MNSSGEANASWKDKVPTPALSGSGSFCLPAEKGIISALIGPAEAGLISTPKYGNNIICLIVECGMCAREWIHTTPYYRSGADPKMESSPVASCGNLLISHAQGNNVSIN